MPMPQFDVSWLPIVAATFAYFLLGAAWYGIFSEPWMSAIGTTKEQIQARESDQRWIYLVQFVATALLVVAAAYWIVNVAAAATATEGLLAALLLSPIAVLASSGDFLYEERNGKLFLINSGYRLVGLLAVGAIVGAWQ